MDVADVLFPSCGEGSIIVRWQCNNLKLWQVKVLRSRKAMDRGVIAVEVDAALNFLSDDRLVARNDRKIQMNGGDYDVWIVICLVRLCWRNIKRTRGDTRTTSMLNR